MAESYCFVNGCRIHPRKSKSQNVQIKKTFYPPVVKSRYK